MDEHRLARGVGWVSIGVGLALLASPSRAVRGLGMGERPNLGRLMGARDLVLGAGLLRGGNTTTWLRARGAADALDAAVILAGMASGAFPRNRAPVGLAMATGFSVLSFVLARRMD